MGLILDELEDKPDSCSTVERERVGVAEPLRADQPLWNDQEPSKYLKREKPEHRAIAMLKAAGLSNREICEQTGYSYPQLTIILHQPWARELIVQELKKAGRQGVETLLQSIAPDAVMKLEEVMNSDDATPDTQRKAAKDVIELAYGRATQKLEVSHPDPNESKTNEELLAVLQKSRLVSPN